MGLDSKSQHASFLKILVTILSISFIHFQQYGGTKTGGASSTVTAWMNMYPLKLTPTSTRSSWRSTQQSLRMNTKDAHKTESITESDAHKNRIIATQSNRRAFLLDTSVVATIASTFLTSTMSTSAHAVDDATDASNVQGEPSSTMGLDPNHPIVIIGAGGKVGKLCTSILTSSSSGISPRYTRAVTRQGRKVLNNYVNNPFVTYAPGDVTKYDSIKEAIQGASGVIFAASASGKKQGGDPAHVDYLGLYHTAKACLECGVPKLVVVSAGSVTRPDFVGFKATNLFVKYVYGDKIMDYKIAGEALMRDLYAGQTKCSYCVVRPGGLSDSPALGPSQIHVSQGDIYTAEITREDVAQVSVAALLKGKSTDFTTFELNNIKGIAKVSDSFKDTPSLIHAGAPTYSQLFDGLFTDEEMKKNYPQFLNDFRGDKIDSVSKLVA